MMVKLDAILPSFRIKTERFVFVGKFESSSLISQNKMFPVSLMRQ